MAAHPEAPRSQRQTGLQRLDHLSLVEGHPWESWYPPNAQLATNGCYQCAAEPDVDG